MTRHTIPFHGHDSLRRARRRRSAAATHSRRAVAIGHALACRIQPSHRSRSQTIPAPAPPPVAAVLSNAELLVRVDAQLRAAHSRWPAMSCGRA